jgi:hypothetical protein
VSASGLDEEKLDLLRRWGGGLQEDGREEVAAAGRAILILIDEIERLHVLLWDTQLYPDSPRTVDVEAHSLRPTIRLMSNEELREGIDPYPQPEPAAVEIFHSLSPEG